MAFCAGRSAKSLGMAITTGGAAMVDTAPALICYSRMRAIVPGEPVIRGMAGGAVCAEHSSMEDRIGMTTYARAGQARELSTGMALFTRQPHVPACQR